MVPLRPNDFDEAYSVLNFEPLTVPTSEKGTIVWDESNNGSFTYTPTPGYTGTFTVNYRVTNPSGMTADAVLTITVADLPTPATNSSKSICITDGSVVLSGNTPTVGTGSWSVVNGPSTLPSQFSGINNPSSTFTPAGGVGNYLVRWTITNNPSPSSTADATITVNAVADCGHKHIHPDHFEWGYSHIVGKCAIVGGRRVVGFQRARSVGYSV